MAGCGEGCDDVCVTSTARESTKNAVRRVAQRDRRMYTRAALVATASANQYDFMGEDELLSQLASNLSSAQMSEARGDGDAAVAKTAAIKNIQKALTARILKRLDDGQPLVEVARKMKAIEGMQP